MQNQDFTTIILVDQTPKEVFNAINNVRGWWSEEIEGSTDKLNDVFKYHYEDVHRCQIKIVEVVSNEKIVWLVVDNYFNFTKDKTEWTGTKIIFNISKQNDKTLVRFTHQGLVPDYECFNICRDAWSNYIQNSLRSLIVTGKGQPNATGKPQTENERKLSETNGKTPQDYTVTITVDAPAHKVFESINNVTRWWTSDLKGNSKKLNDEFTVQFGDVHFSKQKLVEIVPGKKVVWLVTDSRLNFVKNENEWTNTKISFEISELGGKTQIKFTHIGLVPEIECYNDCSNAWSQYLNGSLFKLLTEGEGVPA